jgi:hypothetical protein
MHIKTFSSIGTGLVLQKRTRGHLIFLIHDLPFSTAHSSAGSPGGILIGIP